MTSPYTLPPYTYGSSSSIHSAPTASFYTMKMYETPVESSASASSAGSRYLPPREVPYHHSPPGTIPEASSAGSATGITFTNPFAPVEVRPVLQPQPQSQPQTSNTNISNQVANSGATFQPLYATFGPSPVFVSCPYCQHTDETIAEPAIGIRSVLCCMALPVFGLLFKSKWDTRHKCKCCMNVIGTHYA